MQCYVRGRLVAILSVDDIVRYAYNAGYRGLELAAISAISLAESGGNTQAHNPGTAAIPEDSWGPLQINLKAHPQYSIAQVTNPAEAFRIAYSDFGSNLNAWSVYKNGASSRFLPQVAAAIARLFGAGPPAPTPAASTEPFIPIGGGRSVAVAPAPTLTDQYGLTDADFAPGGRAAAPTADEFTGVTIKPPETGSAGLLKNWLKFAVNPPGATAEFLTSYGVGDALSAVADTGGAIVALAKWLTAPEHWWRILFTVAGGALVIVGLGIYLREPVTEALGGPALAVAKAAA